jgi:hypothetical protein
VQATMFQVRNDADVVGRVSLVTCSLCLRVLRGDEWIDAEQAIRALRSYDLPSPVSLAPGLCDECRDELAERRAADRVLAG